MSSSVTVGVHCLAELGRGTVYLRLDSGLLQKVLQRLLGLLVL